MAAPSAASNGLKKGNALNTANCSLLQNTSASVLIILVILYFMVTSAKAAFNHHNLSEPFLVCNYNVHQSTTPYLLLSLAL